MPTESVAARTASRISRVSYFNESLRKYGLWCILATLCLLWIYPLVGILLTVLELVLFLSFSSCRIPDSAFAEAQNAFFESGLSLNGTEIDFGKLYQKGDLAAEFANSTELHFTRFIFGLSARARFLIINFDFSKIVMTPKYYWVLLGRSTSYGETTDIQVDEFEYTTKVDRPRGDDRVLNRTWQHATKNNEPDRRYRENPEMWEVERHGINLYAGEYEAELFLFPKLSSNSFANALRAMGARQADHDNIGKEEGTNNDQVAKESEHLEWYDVLEVSQDAPLGDISSAYPSLIKQYHPDRVASLGPKLRAVAEKEAKAINDAYQTAKKVRGGRSPQH
ncbi:MAG: J domain-containing protein [Hyphomicrobiales bacterium]|nr:J domain-containing protein [Hyphomicrobiales bacterium]